MEPIGAAIWAEKREKGLEGQIVIQRCRKLHVYILFVQVKGEKMMENNAKQRVPFDLKAKSYLSILLS